MSKQRIIAGTMTWGEWGRKWSTAEMQQYITGLHDLGITTYDHADIYGGYTTEAAWGKAWKGLSIPRAEVEIISKCGIMLPSPTRPDIRHKHYDHSYEHIIASARRSVDHLQCEYLDTLLIHRPGPLMRYDQVARAASDLLAEGLIKSFGVSNFLPHQMESLRQHIPIMANQVEVSIAHLSPLTDGLFDYCSQHQIGLMAWSPLGRGALWTDDALSSRLGAVADKYGWSIQQVAYLFLLHHPSNLRLVVGTTRLPRMQEALSVLDLSITDDVWYEIYSACLGTEVA